MLFSPQFGTSFLITSFTLFSLFVATLILSKGIARDRINYTWLVGLGLGCIGTFQVGLSLLVETPSTIIDPIADGFLSNYALLFGVIFFLIALVCQPLMFCGLRLSRRAYRVVLLGVIFANIFLFIALWILNTNEDYFLRLLLIHSFTMGISLWLLIELILLRRSAPSPALNIIFPVSIITFSLYVTWILVIFLAMLGLVPSVLSQDQFNQWDLNFRFLRGSLFIVSEIVIFVYWLQTQSTIALTDAKNKEAIFKLLTEKDKLIAHLVNTRALIEMGALSAGVAHEINQFLTRIQLNSEEAESLLDQVSAPKQVQDSLLRIQDAVRDASNVISSIKKLFSKTDPAYSMTRIDVLVLDMVDIYSERAQQSYIRIETKIEAERVWMISDTLLRQVIGNLIANSIEALEPVVSSDKKILIQFCIKDQCLCIDVIDNGPGVAPNKIHNLFSLFDTNKSNGSGVGLWLSMRMIEQHSGRIYYSEALNGGAVFSIEIPDVPQVESKSQLVYQ